MKICSRCHESKEDADFNFSIKTGLQPFCKLCQRAYAKEHYKNNRETYYARNKTTINKIREYIDTLKGVPCADCGLAYDPICMDFDHTGGDKIMNVSAMRIGGKSLNSIKEEIAKCEVVCANCHRIRTKTRKGGDSNI